ncbi:MAG: response regulator transcription factor [Dehalococcoidia bacterium]|nr:response regulator transcription factor [Dehalococcoidia bacterium]
MSKVLIIGHNNEEQRRVIQGLERQPGHECRWADGLRDALTAVEDEAPDAVVLNLADPVLSQRDIRDLMKSCATEQRVPVLAYLREDQLASLDLSVGFDDFVVDPVRPAELAARLAQSLRRLGKATSVGDNVIRCADLVMDTNRYEVAVAGQPIDLTYKEFELLRFLAANQDKVFTREMLLNRVWGYDYFGGARTVDVHVRRLRSKIEDRDHQFIETVRNVGYRFRPVPLQELRNNTDEPS